ncbi:MAG: helix-turn-helix domain-containing protein [Alphaproteobacteria bacterium]
MAKKADGQQQAVKAALALAGELGWRRVTLAGIAAEAKVPLADMYRYFPSKMAVLAGFGRLVDEAMLADGPADPQDPPRDRLFDLLMRRFDALVPYRPGVTAIARDLRADPLAALAQLPQLERSMRWALEGADIPVRGVLGLAKVRVLATLYLLVLRVWIDDDTPDMARTMKALDSRLNQADQLAATLERGGRRHTPPADPPPDTVA